jgi:hypothetical protein
MGFLSDLFGGPSPQEEAAQSQMATTAKDMAYDASVTFGQDQAMFTQLSSQLSPILAAGPSQFGMSTAQEAAERTMASTQLSQAGQEESQMVNESLASRGITPGAGISPGALAEIEGSLSQKYAIANSQAQLGITEKGYDIGRQNFWQAAGGASDLMKTQGSLSTSEANTGVNAGTQSFDEAKTIQSQKGGMLKGLLTVGGDIAGGFIGVPMLGNQLVGAAGGGTGSSGAGTESLGSGLKSIGSTVGGWFGNGGGSPQANPLPMGTPPIGSAWESQ